jgi:hypothetical protein
MKKLIKYLGIIFITLLFLSCQLKNKKNENSSLWILSLLSGISNNINTPVLDGSSESKSVIIFGILYDFNGNPLTNAKMSFSNLSTNLMSRAVSSEVYTDADGMYEIETTNGSLNISVTKSDGTGLGSFSIKVEGEKTPIVENNNSAFQSSEPQSVVRLKVTNQTPQKPILLYPSSAYTLTRGQFIQPIVAKNNGGLISSCIISPSLPVGLNLKSNNCTITGIPSVSSSSQIYQITASNAGGEDNFNLNLSVISPEPPNNLNYSGSPFIFNKSQQVSITPLYSGGKIRSCTSTPSLASTGLILDPISCRIFGTASSIQNGVDYTIRASNSNGNISTNISLQISDVSSPPVIMDYTINPLILTVGLSIEIKFSVIGSVTSFSITPSLPDGLSLNNSTGVIKGTPNIASSSKNYVVRASNSKGFTTTNLTIEVKDRAPSELSYSNSYIVLTKDIQSSPITPTFVGSISSCKVSPDLPNGLILSNSDCSISGTPTQSKESTLYKITASNVSGEISTSIYLTVNNLPPSNLRFNSPQYTLTQNSYVYRAPSYDGTITSCNISPMLPAGLQIGATCIIYGTPTESMVAKNYTITASNGFGFTSTELLLTVNSAPPRSLSYSDAPYTFSENVSVGSRVPTYSGTITSCTSDPSLPFGLSLSQISCAITGTPIVSQIATNHKITASNSSGFTETTISVRVRIASPSNLKYPSTSVNFTQFNTITTQTPTFTGSVSSCSILPDLPTGLILNPTTCAISGNPSVEHNKLHTVTASNSSGSTSTTLTIIVNQSAPRNLAYSTNSYTFTQNLPIVPIKPTFLGTLTSCRIGNLANTNTIPTGLAINNSTCEISGTPTTSRASTPYIVVASNSVGSVSVTINITINIEPPSNLDYILSSYEINTFDPITITPTYKGTISSCTISPLLPSGLSINSTNCEIKGTSTLTHASKNYVVTASNSTGSTTKTISITIFPFQIQYSPIGLFKTYQSTVYLTGDDGTYQKGIANNRNIRTDPLIRWQKCNAGQTGNTAQRDGPCIGTELLYTWDQANAYCNSLNQTGLTWRLPTVDELMNQIEYSRNPPMSWLFNDDSIYWASNSAGSTNSYYVSLNDGFWAIYSKTYKMRVRCVLGQTEPQKSFTDNKLLTIKDNNTGLVWHQCSSIANCSARVLYTWAEAINYCQNLTFYGRINWRAPNINELRSLLLINKVDYPKIDSTLFPGTGTSQNSVNEWSSTTVNNSTTSAYTINFYSGTSGTNSKTSLGYVRCVHDP